MLQVHLVWSLSLIYLPLFTLAVASDSAYSTDQYPEPCGVLIVLANIIFIIGYRTISDKMQNPFGSDFEDLSVKHYLEYTMKRSRRILEVQMPNALSPEEELELHNQQLDNIRVNNGDGKDIYTDKYEYST